MKKTAVIFGLLLTIIAVLFSACANREDKEEVILSVPSHPEDSFVTPETEEKEENISNEPPVEPALPEDPKEPEENYDQIIDRPQDSVTPEVPTPTPEPLPNPDAGLQLTVTELVLEEEQSLTLGVIFVPKFVGDDQTILFRSSDESVLTVDESGRITAVHYGNAVVMVSDANGYFTATCAVTVLEKPDPNAGITLDQNEITLEQGQAGKLTATFVPMFDTDDLNLTFTSSDTYILTVTNDGNFTTEGYGIVKITVTTSDGKFRASCQVTVKEKPNPNAGLKLDKTSLSLQEGKSGKITATFVPIFSADSTALSYSSSKKAVATVDSKGNIQAVAPGTATITVKNKDGVFVATCKVTVTAKPKPYNVDDTVVKVYMTGSKEVISMPLGDYIVGAMMKEMGLNYQREALRAQVIAIRSYMLYVINIRGAKHTGGAVVCDSHNCCMAFMSQEDAVKRYGKDNANLRITMYKELVTSTKGQVVFYKGDVIQAFFHSASYKATESSKEVWGGNRPYLQSVPSEGECKKTTYYCTLTQVAKALGISTSKFNTSQKAVGNVVLTEGQRVKTITLFGREIDGTDLRIALELPSASYTVTYSDGKFKFVVMGSGHGVGMSQIGAEAMAARGCDAVEILTHYYTGCTVGTYTKKI